VAARGGVEPMTFRTDNIHLTNHAPLTMDAMNEEEVSQWIYYTRELLKVIRAQMGSKCNSCLIKICRQEEHGFDTH